MERLEGCVSAVAAWWASGDVSMMVGVHGLRRLNLWLHLGCIFGCIFGCSFGGLSERCRVVHSCKKLKSFLEFFVIIRSICRISRLVVSIGALEGRV